MDAPSNPTEGRSPVGEEAPSRASPRHVGIPPFPNLSARDISRVPTSPEKRDRPSRDQGIQDRSYGHGSPDFGGGVGYHDDDTYRGGPIPKNIRSPARAPHTPKMLPEDNVPKGCSLQSMEPLREWFCKGADMTSPAEYEAALCQLEEDPPDIRQHSASVREERWPHFSLEGVGFPTTTRDVIRRGGALAIFERDFIIRFQQISRAAALYIRALLGGVKRTLEIYRRVDLMRLPRTTRAQSRPQKRNGMHMRKVS